MMDGLKYLKLLPSSIRRAGVEVPSMFLVLNAKTYINHFQISLIRENRL